MLSFLATSSDAADAGIGAGFLLLWLIILAWGITGIIGLWKLLTLMGEPGWPAIISPIAMFIIFKRTRGDQAVIYTIGSLLCCLVAFVGYMDLAKLFGKEPTTGILWGFFPPLMLMEALKNPTYVGPQVPPTFG